MVECVNEVAGTPRQTAKLKRGRTLELVRDSVSTLTPTKILLFNKEAIGVSDV
jgi:hypothetical protein